MISFGGVETTCKVLYKEYIIPQASTIICNIQDYTIKITSQKGMIQIVKLQKVFQTAP